MVSVVLPILMLGLGAKCHHPEPSFRILLVKFLPDDFTLINNDYYIHYFTVGCKMVSFESLALFAFICWSLFFFLVKKIYLNIYQLP
jgi:hypothetical protein